MFTATLCVDILLGDVRSLKHKRGIVRPLVSEVRRRFEVAVAETGNARLYRRAEIGIATVAGEAARCEQVLDEVERFVVDRPELEVLATRRQLISSEDE